MLCETPIIDYRHFVANGKKCGHSHMITFLQSMHQHPVTLPQIGRAGKSLSDAGGGESCIPRSRNGAGRTTSFVMCVDILDPSRNARRVRDGGRSTFGVIVESE